MLQYGQRALYLAVCEGYVYTVSKFVNIHLAAWIMVLTEQTPLASQTISCAVCINNIHIKSFISMPATPLVSVFI